MTEDEHKLGCLSAAIQGSRIAHKRGVALGEPKVRVSITELLWLMAAVRNAPLAQKKIEDAVETLKRTAR
jgi:hypothetical protein